MARKPSATSLRARQRNLIEGRQTKGVSNRQVAHDLGVKPSDIARFLRASPKEIKRSSRLQKVYEASTRPALRSELGVKRIRVYPVSVKEIKTLEAEPNLVRKYPDVVSTGYEIMSVMHPSSYRSHLWADFIEERGLPVSSYGTLRQMYLEGRLDEEDWDEVEEAFTSIYKEA